MLQKMKQTPARTRFKSYFGQANHYLVTALVGLHHLDSSDITSAPPELHAAWNPKNKKSSIQRTKIFALQSILGSAVDAIDMYISLLYRKPNYLSNTRLESELDAANRSVQKKVIAIASHYQVEPCVFALLDILITWRNNVIHVLAENTLRVETRKTLIDNKDKIAECYRGLIIDNLADKAEKGDGLTFKEAASLINAAHHFVEQVDSAVIKAIDIDVLCLRLVQDEIDNKEKSNSFYIKYNSLTPEKRQRFVRIWLANNYGIVDIDEALIERCSNLKR